MLKSYYRGMSAVIIMVLLTPRNFFPRFYTLIVTQVEGWEKGRSLCTILEDKSIPFRKSKKIGDIYQLVILLILFATRALKK